MLFPEFFIASIVRRTQADIPGVALLSAKGRFFGGTRVLSLDSITDSINGSLNSKGFLTRVQKELISAGLAIHEPSKLGSNTHRRRRNLRPLAGSLKVFLEGSGVLNR